VDNPRRNKSARQTASPFTANASGATIGDAVLGNHPSGTIRISHVDTYWNANGSTSRPFDWSIISNFVAALVPQPDGLLPVRSPEPPEPMNLRDSQRRRPGYYWLRLGPRDT